MKKYLILSFLCVFALPVFAVCPVDGGVCQAYSNWNPQPLPQKLVPDNLQEIQNTDAFRPKYFQPYNDALINTENSTTSQTNDYNSNCQFGVCLPEANESTEIFE